MKETIIPINSDKVKSFCKRHHIITLALFGSILTSHFNANSDVDILVSFEAEYTPNFFELVDMESELSLIFGRNVDLKLPNDLSPYFRDEILLVAKTIYD